MKSKKKIVIISPSGNFYGSEQVLYDYLSHTKAKPEVLVKAGGLLSIKLNESLITFSTFRNTYFLYLRLMFWCIYGKVKSVYINEGAHSKYICFLSSLFKSVRFVAHVRIMEDTKPARWKGLPKENFYVLSISKYIQKSLPFESCLIYDPYPWSTIVLSKKKSADFCIGVIGRVSVTKGIDNILQLLDVISNENILECSIHFYGDITDEVGNTGRLKKLRSFENVFFHGFTAKHLLYSKIDCVLHLAEEEPLGRVFLEAIDLGIPFIGLDKGGVGEIAGATGLNNLMINDGSDYAKGVHDKLLFVKNNHDDIVCQMSKAKEKAQRIFSLEKYTNMIDEILEGR